MIWDIDFIFSLRVHIDKLQIIFEIHSDWMIFGQLTAVGVWNRFLVWECIMINYRSTLKIIPVEWFLANLQYLSKFQGPRAITRPKIIGPERNVNLICNSSLYTHIPNIKSICQRITIKSGDNCFISELRNWATLYPLFYFT
jgi:hypothetical protein